MKIQTLLVDGDILTYKAGFCLEETVSLIQNFDTGEAFEVTSKEDVMAILKAFEGDYCEVKQFKRIKENAMPVGFIIKMILDSINVEHNERKIFITDTNINNNFRKQLDPEYKQNRNKSHKPLLYAEAREALVNEFDAIEVSGVESDDVLGISQVDDTSIIASIDKYMMMIPGWHYNLNTKEIIHASDPGKLTLKDSKLKGFGFRWFCAQMLLGDVIDNVIGLHGYGPVKTNKLLKDLKTPKELFDKVASLYIQEGRKEDITKNSQLLWIQRNDYRSFFDYMEEHDHD